MARTHRYSVQIRWDDLDLFGHVNNVLYHSYLQEARVDLLFTQGAEFGITGPGSMSEGVVVAHQSIDHLVPIEYPCAPIIVESWVSRIGGASFTLSYVILDSADESCIYAKATSVLVPFDKATHKSRRLTEREREVLGWFSPES
jgi:acyl-CoA thioester hydrolase